MCSHVCVCVCVCIYFQCSMRLPNLYRWVGSTGPRTIWATSTSVSTSKRLSTTSIFKGNTVWWKSKSIPWLVPNLHHVNTFLTNPRGTRCRQVELNSIHLRFSAFARIGRTVRHVLCRAENKNNCLTFNAPDCRGFSAEKKSKRYRWFFRQL